MSQSDADPENRVMSNLADTFDIIMSARTDQFGQLPVTYSIEFPGEEVVARGSARHVADIVQESGYSTELEYDGEAEPVPGLDAERHAFTLIVDDD